ncbi:MAG: DinB family protein [Gemmatimonadetes bacterium]|nr:DinB family protein [Gemmatimonadota bacterium]
MSDVATTLARQLETAWGLAWYHLETLTDEECLWRPADRGLHLIAMPNGEWAAGWPDHEGYDLGPPSIGWTTWHIGFWWSMALDHGFGGGTLTKDEVRWPGSAGGVRQWIRGLHDRWRAEVAGLAADDLASNERTRWPFRGRPFADVVAWVNVELTKNAAEIGYARFLFARRAQ